MATRVTEPRYHCFTNIRKEAEAEAEDDDADMIELRQRGSSPIFSTYCFGKGEKLPLSLLDACRQSRQEFQKIFTPLSQGGYRMEYALRQLKYSNTMYDYFYLGNDVWSEYKALVDMMIRLNTTRELDRSVRLDLEAFQKIRLLIVDFVVFAGAPARVWAEFSSLEELTIAFHPLAIIKDFEESPGQYNLLRDENFLHPSPSTKCGKRAEWIIKSATEALEVINDVPGWKRPKIQALVRVPEECDGKALYFDDRDEDEYEYEGTELEGRPIEKDDSAWYQQATERMAQQVSAKEIKKLKQIYHPCRKEKPIHSRLFSRWHPNPSGKKAGEYWTDSEGEEGKMTAREGRYIREEDF
jgi:hypothetical protein